MAHDITTVNVYLEPEEEIFANCRLSIKKNDGNGWVKYEFMEILDGSEITTYVDDPEDADFQERQCFINEKGRLYYEEDFVLQDE